MGIAFSLDAFVDHPGEFYANQYVYGRTSKNALREHRLPQCLNLGDGVITALLRRPDSRLDLWVQDGKVAIRRDGRELPLDVTLPAMPPYFGRQLSNGMRTDDFIAVAGEVTPGFFLYPDCFYFPDGVPCSFCSLRHTRKTSGKEMADSFDIQSVKEAAAMWMEASPPIISLTTGTFPNGDAGALYIARIVEGIRAGSGPDIPIEAYAKPQLFPARG